MNEPTSPQTPTRDSVTSSDWLGDGFVFIDHRHRPYMVKTCENGQAWLHYWHADKHWVTLRRLHSPSEIWTMKAMALAPGLAKLYAPNEKLTQ